MGTRERRQRDVAEREERILSAALELIRADGLLSLQMSRIAEKCEYAVGTLYQHFASKEDLLLALVTNVVRDHLHLMNRCRAWDAPPRHRMMAIAMADIVFVRKHPDYFRVLQYSLCGVAWNATSAERRQGFLEAQAPLIKVVVDIFGDALARGDLPVGTRIEDLAIGPWALCFGYHNLVHAEGLLDSLTLKEPYRLMCQHLQCLLDGFRWQPLPDPNDPSALDGLLERIRVEVFPETCDGR